jgi:hypothetical protein
VNASETAFLVLGLVLGVAVGVALWQAVRSKPAPRREVRVTISPNSVPPRRGSTLAAPGGRRDQGPLPGSPDADALGYESPGTTMMTGTGGSAVAAPGASGGRQVRTPVLTAPAAIPANAVAVPVVGSGIPDVLSRGPSAFFASPVLAAAAVTSMGSGARVAFPVPVLIPSAPRARASVPSASRAQQAGVDSLGDPMPTTAGPPSAMAGDTGGPDGPAAGSAPGEATTDACADERRLVDERCTVADAARDEARRAADALRDAHNAYDALQERVARAQEVADPRRVADAKASLHATFRASSDASAGPDEAEAAAREWLDAINRLNAALRDASRLVELGGAELRAQLPTLDRLGHEADAARIAADNAADACQAARERLAACDEALALAEAASVPEPPEEHPFARVWPAEEPDLRPTAAPLDAGVSSIVRVLRGDRDARERIVAALAGADPDAQREWRLRIAHLVDAITARAIEDGYLDLPPDDPFWGMFDARERRDIVGALSALGFRFDGMGGFADARVPATRDLALAVGYAGLDRMRVRAWPREDAMGGLYTRAAVAADEWLVDFAGDLSLGRMVDALGSRAAALADTWNAWGRVRLVLLAE